jgi:TolA-binding protein
VPQHISRKELKRDEVAETLAHGAEAVLSHQRALWVAASAALVVVLAVVGWRFYTERQTTRAAAALNDAMKVFQAPIRTSGEPQTPGEITYVDEKSKFSDAATKFLQVAQRYPRTRPGQVARYYAGLSYVRLGRYHEAQRQLREVASGGDDGVAALARFQLAGVLDQAGRPEEAVKLYQQLIEKPSVLVPKPLVLLTLAEHYRKTNPPEARRIYNQVKSEFPASTAAEEAEKRLQELNAKS